MSYFISMHVKYVQALQGEALRHAREAGLSPVLMLLGDAFQDEGAEIEAGTVVVTHGGEDGSMAVKEGKLPVYCRNYGVQEVGYVVCCHPAQVGQKLNKWVSLGNWTCETQALAERLDANTGASLGYCTLDEVVAGEYIRLHFQPKN